MMRSHDIRYLTREGLRNVWQNRFMSLASIGVLVCCLLLTGFSYLVFVNIDHLFQSAYEQNVIAVFLHADTGDLRAEGIGTTLREMPNVAEVTFISKEEYLERYADDLPQAVYESYQGDANPLPDSYIVSLVDLAQMDQTIAQIRSIAGVEEVSYDGDIAATLTQVRHLVLGVGGAIIVVLLVVSLFIIANTIKLTVYNRRLEIYIMCSVGATDSFVRFPFVVEGVVLGLCSGTIAFGLIDLLYSQLARRFVLGTFARLLPFSSVWGVVLAGFLIGGVLVGVCGSAISTTRYLRTEGGVH